MTKNAANLPCFVAMVYMSKSCGAEFLIAYEATPALRPHHLVFLLGGYPVSSKKMLNANLLYVLVLVSLMRLPRKFVVPRSIIFAPDSHVLPAISALLWGSGVGRLLCPVLVFSHSPENVVGV